MDKRIAVAVASLAAATLLLETTLTRFLAVSQFYHFAFLVVSLALLGFGASGSLLSLSPRLRNLPLDKLLPYAGLAFTTSVIAAYIIVNLLPFDSYSIAWDPRQVLYFLLYYLALSLPFLCAGLGIGAALSSANGFGYQVYAANLIGSGFGVLVALFFLWLGGVPVAMIASCILALSPIFLNPSAAGKKVSWVALVLTLSGTISIASLAMANLTFQAPLGLIISPYKGLVQALRYPGAQVILSRWNAISRLDVIANSGLHALPGLSYTYTGPIPEQYGLSIDGDSLSPVTNAAPSDFSAGGALPETPAFQLRPEQPVLILEAGAGLSLLQAISNNVGSVTAVTSNSLIPLSLSELFPGDSIYIHPQVHTVTQTARQYLAGNQSNYPLIFLPLTDPYRPVSSGAYSLSESYLLTTEALLQAIGHLEQDGILIITRWLQTPPSESVRMLTTIDDALVRSATPDPEKSIVAYRGIQTMTFLVQPDGWNQTELNQVRAFTDQKRYDLVWAPDISTSEINRHNLLPEPDYYRSFADYFNQEDKSDFFNNFPFDVRPATDNHPFFYHFFTWKQTPEIIAGLGKTWQPFGGSGYLVLLALLILVIVFSAILILAPLALPAFRKSNQPAGPVPSNTKTSRNATHLLLILFYYTLIGIAFLFVEIPLIQSFILLMGHPTYAFTFVVLVLLLFSGIGSLVSAKLPFSQRSALLILVFLSALTPLVVSLVINFTLAWPNWARVFSAVICLAPMATFMGLPFPVGLAQLENKAHQWIPWAWGVNGCASVIASVLAAIITLDRGFNAVLWLGSVAYACAFLVYMAWTKPNQSISPLPTPE